MCSEVGSLIISTIRNVLDTLLVYTVGVLLSYEFTSP